MPRSYVADLADVLVGHAQLVARHKDSAILIARRRSTICYAADIVVIDRGRIAESRTPDELLAAGER